jgi:hypothetical protein
MNPPFKPMTSPNCTPHMGARAYLPSPHNPQDLRKRTTIRYYTTPAQRQPKRKTK